MARKKDAEGIHVPTLLEAFEAYGIATERLTSELNKIAAKFPPGKVPLAIVQNIAAQFVNGEVLQKIVDGIAKDGLSVLTTGRGPVARDDSSLS